MPAPLPYIDNFETRRAVTAWKLSQEILSTLLQAERDRGVDGRSKSEIDRTLVFHNHTPYRVTVLNGTTTIEEITQFSV